MIRFILLSTIAIISFGCKKEYGKLEISTSLPSALKEVSGIEFVKGNNLLWMINDSGNASKVYGYNVTTQKIGKVINLTNVSNQDWEDTASDSMGNLYIGDFGNNANTRKDLAIFTVDSLALVNSNETTAIRTSFYFEDQDSFPPKKKDKNFDVEAFIFYNDSFYLFSRNRSSSFDGTTKLYKVPAKEGNFEAKLLRSFKTCDNSINCQITGAAIDNKTGKIALLSFNKVWILSDYIGDNFFGGTIQRINLDDTSQKESITFKDSNTLYIADERKKNSGGNLFILKV